MPAKCTEPWSDFWFPLEGCYRRQGITWVPPERIEPSDIPAPYQQLMVHEDDMTPTLSRYYKDSILIQCLFSQMEGSDYCREVVLCLHSTGKQVEWGGIRIFLDRFPSEVQERILQERLPLGDILQQYAVAHHSRPMGFFRMRPNDYIRAVLGPSEASWLYGRRNRLTEPSGAPLAEIIEILPA